VIAGGQNGADLDDGVDVPSRVPHALALAISRYAKDLRSFIERTLGDLARQHDD
jgi:hypothetical protein